jgi:uncharacterized Zn finger protein
MPESHRARRYNAPLMLTEASSAQSLVKATCSGCSPTRWYDPGDLVRLYGDVPAMNLSRMMRCGRCGDHLHVEIRSPDPAERQRIKVRRIDSIWWVKRVRWRED